MIALCIGVIGLAPRLEAAGPTSDGVDLSRIVSLGGAITEILYELGLDDRIVAVDTTSLYPPEALKTHKNVGYFRAVSTEGVLSMAPSIIFASDKAGPPEVVRALEASGIPYVKIVDDPDVESLKARVKAIAEKAGRKALGDKLVERIEKGFATLAQERGQLKRAPSTLFLMSVQGGRATVGGADTSSDAMLKLAGAKNAAASVKGFKPISEEAILAMNPEAIVMMSRGSEVSGIEAVLALPGVAATRAGRDKRVIEMDGLYLLGFGPRAPQAASDLMKKLQAPVVQDSKG
jgi:iron complex transport system substrate-binding protein